MKAMGLQLKQSFLPPLLSEVRQFAGACQLDVESIHSAPSLLRRPDADSVDHVKSEVKRLEAARHAESESMRKVGHSFLKMIS